MKYEEQTVKNAIIESVSIKIERGGILDIYIFLNFGNASQGFGGWALYLDDSFTHHKREGFAGHHIFQIMKIAGVESWDALKGKAIRARGDSNKIVAIGHILNDEWYEPTMVFDAVNSVVP